jgi:hypothetical protein
MTRLLLCTATILALTASANAFTCDPSEIQMMGVIWRILTANTGNAEHPGKVMDYAAFTDFNVDIEIGPQNYVLHIEARSKLDA